MDKKEAESDESKKIMKEPLAPADKDEEKHLQNAKNSQKKNHKHKPHAPHTRSEQVKQVEQLLKAEDPSDKEIHRLINDIQLKAAEAFCKAERMIKLLE